MIKLIKIEPVKSLILQIPKDKPSQEQNKPDVLIPISKQKSKFGEKMGREASMR